MRIRGDIDPAAAGCISVLMICATALVIASWYLHIPGLPWSAP